MVKGDEARKGQGNEGFEGGSERLNVPTNAPSAEASLKISCWT